MRKAVDEEFRLRKVDVLQCEYLQMASYYRPGPRSILTEHEAVSANAYQAFLRTEDTVEKLRLFSRWMAMLNYESSACRRFNRIVTMTKEDADYLRSYVNGADIRHIPIGIDTDRFQPVPEESSRPLEVLFMGNFRHTPNVEAADFLLREIAPYFPDLRFVIAGSHLSTALTSSTNTVFPGYVADTRTLFHGSKTIFAAPLFSGTGQRVKLLEAFAMGSSVITTSIGGMGFPLRDRHEALIAETAAGFRAALSELASSQELRVSLGKQARRMVENDFNWKTIGREFLRLVEEP
jgi:glycosyltransferase involved in cell wall biosynthesis